MANIDYFFRGNPFDGGFTVFAGLSELMRILNNLSFHEDELSYLQYKGFDEHFLDYLRDFKFKGTIYAAREGEVVFHNEPVLLLKVPCLQPNLLRCCF